MTEKQILIEKQEILERQELEIAKLRSEVDDLMPLLTQKQIKDLIKLYS